MLGAVEASRAMPISAPNSSCLVSPSCNREKEEAERGGSSKADTLCRKQRLRFGCQLAELCRYCTKVRVKEGRGFGFAEPIRAVSHMEGEALCFSMCCLRENWMWR